MKTKCCKAPNLKMTKAWTAILTVVMALVLAAGIVVCALFGFNNSRKDVKAINLSVDSYSYKVYGSKIEDTAENVLTGLGLEVEDKQKADMGAPQYELVYVFDKDTSDTVLNDAVGLLESALKDKKSGFPDASFSISAQNRETVDTMAKQYVLRGVIAILIFAVVSFLYVWIRYKLFAALYTLCGNVLAGGLTTALIALTRIPVTPAVGAAIAASVLFSTVTILFFFNKLRAAQKEDNASESSAKEIVVSSIAWKETLLFAGILCAALIVMIFVGKSAIAWFSLSAILAIVASTFIGLLYVPTIFVPAKKCADKLAAQKASGYKGAKKGEKAQKSDDEELVD